MKKKRIKLSSLMLAFALLLGLAAPSFAAENANIKALGSLADSYTATGGTFTLNSGSRIFVLSNAMPEGELLQTVQLAQRQFAAAGYPGSGTMDILWDGGANWVKTGDVVVNLDPACGLSAEGYKLTVGDTAMVTASDVDGLLYGLNTLLKQFRAVDGNTVSGFTLTDEPDTVERTVSLDCGRKYFSAEWICNFIKQMSWMGYNTLELHFSDDGGFRMDIWDPTYYTDHYKPSNDFSWICGSHVQSWVGSAYANDPDAGKYLTMSEMIGILETAQEYHIEVIPAFDSPSHMDYLCWKFEQNYKSDHSYSFTYNGTSYSAASTSGCINYCGKTGSGYPEWCEYTTIDINDDTARGKMAQAFVFQLYSDIADFFREYAGSTKFSVGADEVNLSASKNISWSYRQFPGYINELNTLLNNKGYTMRMFNDFIYSDYIDQFADNIEILYWNSPYHATSGTVSESKIMTVQQMVNDGRKLYNAIQTNTYYVLRIADGISSGSANYMKDARDPTNTNWTFYHSDEDSIYDEWYPADISEHGNASEDVADVPEGQLGGGYFLLWNDYASAATENQVWNGMDSTGKWNVIDRMWSNTIKMWNWDINNDVSYREFSAVRDRFGYFPGYTSCSAAASMPGATAPENPADHTEPETSDSTFVGDSLTVIFKTPVNEIVIKTENVPLTGGSRTYQVYLPPMSDYVYNSIRGVTYIPLTVQSGFGFFSGMANSDATVTVRYKSVPDPRR